MLQWYDHQLLSCGKVQDGIQQLSIRGSQVHAHRYIVTFPKLYLVTTTNAKHQCIITP